MGLHSLWLSLVAIPREVAATQRWAETPCEVLESKVKTHSDLERGDWFSLDMSFKYEFDGQDYSSDRYDLSTGGCNEPVQAVVARLPAGTQTVCYVNPDFPSEAVMKREGEKIGFGLGAAACTFFGAVGMLLTLIIRMKKNPIEMIGDSVFLIVDRVIDAMDPSANPKQTGGKNR